VVRERASLVNQLQSILRDLGLERRSRNVPDLTTYLASKAHGGASTPSSESATVQSTSVRQRGTGDQPPTNDPDDEVAATGGTGT